MRLKISAIAGYPQNGKTGRASDMAYPFRRSILLLALSALVAGCATAPEQLAQRDSERCAARGYQPSSKAHDDCLSQLANQRDARTQARHRELVERPALPPAFNR